MTTLARSIPNSNPSSKGTTGQKIYFDAMSDSNLSHTAEVIDKPLVLQAYNLTKEDYIDVLQVSQKGDMEWPLMIGGQKVCLTSSNTTITLAITGWYRFSLSGGRGHVVLTGHESLMR